MADVDSLQQWHYIAGIAAYTVSVIGAVSGAVWWALKRQRETIAALQDRIAVLEQEAVTVTTFRESLREMLDRFESRMTDLMIRIDERFRHVAERQADLKEDLKDLKIGQEGIKNDIAALPCPRDAKCG